METYEIELGKPYVDMVEEMKSDEVTIEEFLSQTTESNVHNLYQRRKNAQQQQQRQQQ